MKHSLPVESILKNISNALAGHGTAVLEAPPGAGKTTRVPLALLKESWLGTKKILLLEPRRLAAVTCAVHMADLLGETVGETVGYRIRLDRKTGPKTRLEVITQGVFVRMIQSDPELKNVGLVIFDEFHERNAFNDLGFAFCLDARYAFCESLKVLVMSATMDTGPVSAIMGKAPVIRSHGKTYPVKTYYCPALDKRNQPVPILKACVDTLKRALTETCEDILVFLPGQGEIHQMAERVTDLDMPDLVVLPLFGNLAKKEQLKIFSPLKQGFRKVILATAIAETSITIDGIGVVIDAGLMRLPRYNPQTGMSRLETLNVSKAAADQRRGRAGRTGPGTCYRIWSEYDQTLLKPFTRPEIFNVDLSGLMLELAAWGITDPNQLSWMDPPGPGAVKKAKILLQVLGALDKHFNITPHGRKMVQLGIHPRLANMILKTPNAVHRRTACLAAALLGERDILRFEDRLYDPDIGLRLEVLVQLKRRQRVKQYGFKVKTALARRILDTARKLEQQLETIDLQSGAAKKEIDPSSIHEIGRFLAMAYPDRIAKRRPHQNRSYTLASGKGAYLSDACTLEKDEYIVVANVDGNPKNARIFLAASYSYTDLTEQFHDQFDRQRMTVWDETGRKVVTQTRQTYHHLVIAEKKESRPDPEEALAILLDQVRKKGLQVLPWTRPLQRLKDRTVFLRQTGKFDRLPDLSDQFLEATLADWLSPFLQNIYTFKQLKTLDLKGALMSLIPWNSLQVIETQAPTHLTVPSGSKLPLQYHTDSASPSVVLEVRLQELFSLKETPCIAGNTIPVTLHLLSPAGRPVQITNDLRSFWENTYSEVKKDLKGRYPKHYWPDDPLKAIPTNRVKPKK